MMAPGLIIRKLVARLTYFHACIVTFLIQETPRRAFILSSTTQKKYCLHWYEAHRIMSVVALQPCGVVCEAL